MHDGFVYRLRLDDDLLLKICGQGHMSHDDVWCLWISRVRPRSPLAFGKNHLCKKRKGPFYFNALLGHYLEVSGSRLILIYIMARLLDLAFGFFVMASGEVAFLVKRMPVSIGLEGFNVNPLPAD